MIDVLLFVFCLCVVISLLRSFDFMVNIKILIYALNVFIGFQLFVVFGFDHLFFCLWPLNFQCLRNNKIKA